MLYHLIQEKQLNKKLQQMQQISFICNRHLLLYYFGVQDNEENQSKKRNIKYA